MRYFAYGSNMSLKRLKHRVPSARVVTVARLLGHQIRFHKIGQDGSAKCDAAPSDQPQDQVIGVIYEIAASDKVMLDRFEGLGRGYEDKTVTVVTTAGEVVSAVTYCATLIDPSLQPFHWYREHVLRGAREHQLPTDYIDTLAQVESIPDPLAARQAQELSIYR